VLALTLQGSAIVKTVGGWLVNGLWHKRKVNFVYNKSVGADQYAFNGNANTVEPQRRREYKSLTVKSPRTPRSRRRSRRCEVAPHEAKAVMLITRQVC